MQVRTRGGDGLWSDWEGIHAEEDAPARSGEVATRLMIVAPSREVELRAAPSPLSGEGWGGGAGTLPPGLRVVLIDSGDDVHTASGSRSPDPQGESQIPRSTPARPSEPTRPVPSPRASPAPRSPASPTVPLQPGAPPRILSRDEWGADRSLMTWTPEYAPVRKFIVHHTATSDGGINPAAAIRAIYQYHAVTLGWGDIGYNYLIDRAGTIYEARFGGPNVAAAHAGPYSEGTDGIALLGTFQDVRPPEPMLASLVALIAWRARSQGIDPLGNSFLIDRVVPNVLAHRDVMSTDCPGDAMYALLPSVRQRVAATPPPPPARPSVRVVSARVTPGSLSATDTLRVDVTLQNAGPQPLASQGPPPGTVYGEGDTYESLGYPDDPGKIRIAVEVDGDTTPDRRFRWGLGPDLAPGETRTVTGFIRFDRPGPHTLWAGVVQEGVEWLHDNLARTAIRVYPPSASSYPAIASLSPELYFPLVMRERNGWSSRLVLMNSGGRPASGSVAFRDGDGRIVAAAPFTIPARGVLAQDLTSIAALSPRYVGAAVVRADAQLAGVVYHEREGGDRMAAEGLGAGAASLFVPLVARNYHGLSSGVQVQNLALAAATVSLTYIQDTGATWGETASIPPQSSTTFYGPAHPELPDGFVGSAVIESAEGQPLAAHVSLLRSDGVAMAYAAQAAGGSGVPVPLVLRNRNGWSSGIQVQNVGSTPSAVRVSLRPLDGPGGPWEQAGIIGHAIAGTFYLPAHPHLPDEFAGSATVRSADGEPLVVLATTVHQRKHVGAAVSGSPEGASAVYIPRFSNDAQGWRTGVQVQNRGAQPAMVGLSFSDPQGAQVLRMDDVISPQGSKNYYAPSIQGLPNGFNGSLVIAGRGGASLSAVVNDVR